MERQKRPATEASECKRCGALILWATTRTGKFMPVDVKPTPNGELVLAVVGGSFGTLSVSKYFPDKHGQSRNRYVPHWVTCPNADEFRKKKPEQIEVPL